MNHAKRIPNLDTVSTLIDRLVVEHVKRFEFAHLEDNEAVMVQDDLIERIRERLAISLERCFEVGNHDAITEVRNTLPNSLIPAIEGLVVANSLLGLMEREKLKEAVCGNPDVDTLTALVVIARVANENRARYRGAVDNSLSAMLAPLEQTTLGQSSQ